MSLSFEPLFNEERLNIYREYNKKLGENPECLLIIENVISLLQNYVLSEIGWEYCDYSPDSLFANKKEALSKIIETVAPVRFIGYLYPVYLIIMAQSSFFLGCFDYALSFYNNLLNLPHIIENSKLYNGKPLCAAKIVHNMCLIYVLKEQRDKAKNLREKYDHIFKLEKIRYNRLINQDPQFKDSFQKEYEELENTLTSDTFYYDNSLDSPCEIKYSILEAMLEDAENNGELCSLQFIWKMKVYQKSNKIILLNGDGSYTKDNVSMIIIPQDEETPIIKSQHEELQTPPKTTGAKTSPPYIAVPQGFVRINFLGNEVTIPKANHISEFLNNMKNIKIAYEGVNGRIQRQVNECKARGEDGWAWIQTRFWTDIYEWDENGSLIIDLLSLIESDAFAVCPPGDVDDKYGKDTKAYKELENLRNILVREARSIHESYENNYETGSIEAFNNAASQIKGMQYGIITNSSINLLAYGAISNMTLNSQAKKADKQYSNDMVALARSTGSVYRRQLVSLMFDQYVPIARELVKLWASEITENVIEYEINTNNTIFREISQYDVEKSQRLCNSISSNDSLEDIKLNLLNAFIACPFNRSIYFKMAQLGLMDKEIFEYANELGGEELISDIKNETVKTCRTNLGNIEKIKHLIAFLVNGATPEDKIMHDIYNPYVIEIKNKYQYFYNLIEKGEIKNYVIEMFNIADVEEFITLKESEIEKKINNDIERIDAKKIWDILISNKLMTIDDITLKNTTDYTSFNNTYIDAIMNLVIKYKKAMIIENEKYLERKNEYENTRKSLLDKWNKLNAESLNLKFFNIKKKTKINKEMAELDVELNKLKSEKAKIILEWI